MRVLIVYDTASVKRNTEKVAESISDTLKTKGIQVQCSYVKDVDPVTVKDYDCTLVGAPTQVRMATGPIRRFLDSLTPQDFSGKLAAAFDTRLKGRFAGGATGGIEKKLKKLGFRVITPGLAAYVEGKGPDLMSGELDKAKRFAEEIASALAAPT